MFGRFSDLRTEGFSYERGQRTIETSDARHAAVGALRRNISSAEGPGRSSQSTNVRDRRHSHPAYGAGLLRPTRPVRTVRTLDRSSFPRAFSLQRAALEGNLP